MFRGVEFLNQIKPESSIMTFSGIISGWVVEEAQKGLMLPKTSGEVSQKLVAGEAVLAVNGKEPVGYCELKVWTPYVVEVGGLIVKPDERNQGIGSWLAIKTAKLAKEKFPEATIFCLAENDVSQRLFEQLGGKIFSKESLPESVWSICPDCAHYSEFPNSCPCEAINLEALLQDEAWYSFDKRVAWKNFLKWEKEHPHEANAWKEKCLKEGWPYHPYR